MTKVLRRYHVKPDPPAMSLPQRLFGTVRAVTAPKQKLGFDPSDLSAVQQVLYPLVGLIDATTVQNLLGKIAPSAKATLGIGFLAAIAYIVYKIINAKSQAEREREIATGASKLTQDALSDVPDLNKTPGWAQRVHDIFANILRDQDVQNIPKKLVDFKNEILSKMGVKSGGNVLITLIAAPKKSKRGAGAILAA